MGSVEDRPSGLRILRWSRFGSAIGLLLACWSFACADPAVAGGWPRPSVPPLPLGAIPETVPPGGIARDDSIRATLRAFLTADSLPAPPAEPAPALVAWLVDRLCYGDSSEVAAIAQRTAPPAWERADTFRVLPLAAALALSEKGEPMAGLGWLDHGRVGPEDRPYRALLEIELLDQGGDSAGAAARADAIWRANPGANWTLPAARRVLLACEEADAPESLLQAAARLRRDQGPSADELAARFRALLTLGREAEARTTGDSLLRLFPGTRTARREALRRLRTDPAAAPRREGGVLFAVFQRHGLFAQADSLLDSMEGTDSLRVVLWEGLLAARRPAEILADSLAESRAWSTDLRTRYRLVRARAARNAGRDRLMDAGYRVAASLGGATRRTALTEWGREAESSCREILAESLYTALMDIPAAADEARFRRGLSRFADSRLGAARSDFLALTAGEWKGAAAFWLSKIASASGDSASVRRELQRAAAAEGYYARRAREELAWRAAGDSSGSFWDAMRKWVFSPGDSARADGGGGIPCRRRAHEGVRAERMVMLRRFGRADWAEREQRALEQEAPVEGRRDRFFCLGLPDLGVRVAVGGGGAPVSLRYPRPFERLVLQESARSGIAPELVWSVARRESLFDPGAVSGAGARGLLQMMGPTAAETASRWGIPAAPLSRVDRNLALGTRHLRDLRDHNDWHLPALLAAYNAGAAKTTEWVSRFPDVDLFIERIGWRETRDYVRAVLDGCWIYRAARTPGPRGR